MKTVFYPFYFLFLLTINPLLSQTNEKTTSKENSSKVMQTQTVNSSEKMATYMIQPEKKSGQVTTIENSFQLNENDQYQGRKIEFLSQLIVKEIPADFPKYEKWMGVRHYNEIIDEYYRKHLDILQPGLKQKLSEH